MAAGPPIDQAKIAILPNTAGCYNANDAVRTLPIGVAMLREEGTGDRWHVIMAGSMFVVAPVLAVFIVAQRHIIRAFTFTSLK